MLQYLVRLRPMLFYFTLWLSPILTRGQSSILIQEQDYPLALAEVSIRSETSGKELLKELTGLSGNLNIPKELMDACPCRIVVEHLSMEKLDTLISRFPEIGSLNLNLKPKARFLNPVVVTGNRSEINQSEAPVWVSQTKAEQLQRAQALSLAEGLAFSPGLRVENNCQNCGFTGVRLNGLDGPYTQILINNRPIFSALAGVYGLDMLPVSLIDRVEVVRGGGSVLYGGNAIAGTVNIITQEPIQNRVELQQFVRLIHGVVPDIATTGFADLVAQDGKGGVRLMFMNRSRDYWDANGDGISELVKWNSQTVSLDAFYRTGKSGRLKARAWFTKEFRRGGSQFDLEPHQTDVTEQLDHRIFGGELAWETLLKDPRHRFSAYVSMQGVLRDSYYGGGGRVLQPGDSLTEADLLAINAYGKSEDLSLVGGAQYSGPLAKALELIAGAEFQRNRVIDRMPGYQRQIDQEVQVLGSYAQLEWKPLRGFSLVGGARFDYVRIMGSYRFGQNLGLVDQNEQLPVLVPRASFRWQFHRAFTVRGGFAQGYRAPQAFDEDLHIETVGGAALFTQFAPDLETERSNNLTLGLSWMPQDPKKAFSLTAEGFYTELVNPFILSGQTELPSGVAVITKRNGAGGHSMGVNLEAAWMPRKNLELSIGGTYLQARYHEQEELWAPESGNTDSLVSTRRWLRTPDFFGFFSGAWRPIKSLEWVVTGQWTGPMLVPHVVDVASEYTELKTTPWFFDVQTSIAYSFALSKRAELEVQAGVRNLFNSFQSDFDSGAERDAGYVYGPLAPRTYVFSVRFSLD